MSDPIESHEAFAARVVQHVVDGGESESAGNIIRSRDAAVRAEALREAAQVAAGMRSEVDAASAHQAWRAAGSKGMSAPFHGDFAGVPTSALHRLEWWLRELDRALGAKEPDDG